MAARAAHSQAGQARTLVAALVAVAATLVLGFFANRPSTPESASMPTADDAPTAPIASAKHQTAAKATHPARAVSNAGTRSGFDSRKHGLAQLDLARTLFETGDVFAAHAAYEQAVQLYPSAETHGALGGLYFRVADRSKAYVHFRRAIEFDPYNADLWLDLANAQRLRVALGGEWHALKKAREVEPGIQIVQDEGSFHRRAPTDANYAVSRGSYTGRKVP